jgi:phage terminase large subunit-like protein
VLSADAYTKHGLNAHGIVFDELHAQPNRELWDVLNTSTGARRQPMMVMITTAGYDRESICWEQHQYAKGVLNGDIEDSSYFSYIAAADENDDWTSPVTWAKANPALGVTIKMDYLEAEARRAMASPAYQNTFRRLHLNQWTSQDSRWLDMRMWDACNGKLPDLTGRRCYGGLDLATTTDIASLVLAFPPVEGDEPTWVLPFFWIPSENMIERGRRDRAPYEAWVRQGLIEATPGNVIDYETIERRIAELCDVYNVAQIAFDPWNATQIVTNLQGLGVGMVEMRQGYVSMSAPTKEMLRLVLSNELAHGGNPVLRWMADHVVVDQDPAGNIKPNKGKSREKIDGIVASIMAIARATLMGGVSVYENQGVRTL